MRTGSLICVASPEMSVRVDFEGLAIDILFAKYWISCLRCLRCLQIEIIHTTNFAH